MKIGGAGSGALGVLRRGLAAVVLSLGMMSGGGSAMGLLAGGMRMASNAVGVLRRGVGAVVLSLSMMSGGGGAMGLLSGGLRMASNAAGVLRRGLGHVIGVPAHTVADDFGYRRGPTRASVFELFHDQNPGAFADDESVTVSVPGAACLLGIIVARG